MVTETVTVSGNGTYTTPTGYTLTPGTTAATGTYQWDATYTSGNGNNATATDVNSSNEQVKVCPTVVNVERLGVHEQPMHIVVTFSGQVNRRRPKTSIITTSTRLARMAHSAFRSPLQPQCTTRRRIA